MYNDRDELIKQAFVYGSRVALEEAGYDPQQANDFAVKLAGAAEAPGMFMRAMRALKAAPGKAWGGVTRGAGAVKGAIKDAPQTARNAMGDLSGSVRRGTMPSRGMGVGMGGAGELAPEDIARAARLALGAGAIGGAGLGIGGTLGTEALMGD